jgi:hypothetical protein
MAVILHMVKFGFPAIRGKKAIKIILGIFVLLVLFKLLTVFLVEPWIKNKIKATWNERSKDYSIEIGKVHMLMMASGIKLEKIRIASKQHQDSAMDVEGEIAFVRITGINLAKAIFKKDIAIRTVTISNFRVEGKMPFKKDAVPPMLSSLNIRIDEVRFLKTDVAMENTANAQAYSVQEGDLKMYDLRIEIQDSLSPDIIKQFEFKAKALHSISADSLYSYKVNGIAYSSISKKLVVDDFSVQPNYSNYPFTARSAYQSVRVEAVLSNVQVHGFPAMAYLKSRSLISSYIEIGEMNIHAFRDKRKEFRHIDKPEFQDMIYNYPGKINIDSIVVVNGNVFYTVHGEQANEPGKISFNEIHAKISKLTNDTLYKTNKAYLELKGETLLMGKGRMTVALKAEIFDYHNTFSLHGTLSNLEAKELNPILEKNAFVYATSGKIDAMHFSFMANTSKATGKMTLLYHELDLAVKDKHTDDTTAFRERLISFIANRTVMDSNPLRGNDVREGIIDFERDPEKFLFNYCFKSILSGIRSTLLKSHS